MLSHSRYIIPTKELSGILGRKGREHLAFKWVHFARLIPAGIYPVIMPGSCKALSLGSFKCFKKPGLIHLFNVPGQQEEAWFSQNSKNIEVVFLNVHHSESGDLRWEFICSGSAPTYRRFKQTTRISKGVWAWVNVSEERLANSQDIRPLGRSAVATGSHERMALCLLKSKGESH